MDMLWTFITAGVVVWYVFAAFWVRWINSGSYETTGFLVLLWAFTPGIIPMWLLVEGWKVVEALWDLFGSFLRGGE